MLRRSVAWVTAYWEFSFFPATKPVYLAYDAPRSHKSPSSLCKTLEPEGGPDIIKKGRFFWRLGNRFRKMERLGCDDFVNCDGEQSVGRCCLDGNLNASPLP